tara:strand:- start:546 stop:779 length:234 start_codon:yes stop_codon:yes gene_type:complete
MQNYPAEFFSKEKKFIHRAGYTLSLALMGIGVLETAHSIPYIIKGESSPIGMALGPVVIACGGVAAYAYLREAKVVY